MTLNYAGLKRQVAGFLLGAAALSAADPPPNAESIDRNFALRTGSAEGLVWHSPAEGPFRLSGFCFFDQDRVFNRLPLHPPQPLPGSVRTLAWSTSGGQVRFRTDSERIVIRVKLRPAAPLRNVARTAQSSFDLLRGAPRERRFAGLAVPAYDENEYQRELWRVSDRRMTEYALNFPLYQGVEKLEIGLAEGARIEPPTPFRIEGPVVVYGGSTLQGSSASRPANTWTMMLSLRLNVEFANMGFSGSGRTEASVAEALALVKRPALYILCSDTNSTLEQLQERFVPFIGILRRAHPTTPILVLPRPRWGGDLRGNEDRAGKDLDTDRRTKAAFLKGEVEKLQRSGDRRIHFKDGSDDTAADFDVESVDGSHMNDLGYYRFANKVEPVIRQILTLP